MRELTTQELKTIPAGTCSSWEISGYVFLATSVATGGVKLISTCSLTDGLKVGLACGLLSMITSVGIVHFFNLLPEQH